MVEKAKTDNVKQRKAKKISVFRILVEKHVYTKNQR